MAYFWAPSTASSVLQWFDVQKDYGASGLGVADDTTTVQAAITAAAVSGGIVYFPPGSYKIVGGLTLTPTTGNMVGFAGCGPSSTLCNAGGAAVDLLTVDGSNVAGAAGSPFFMSDLAMYGLVGSRDLLVLNNAHRSHFRNVYLPGAARYATVLKSLLCTFVGCRWNQNDLNAINRTPGASAYSSRGLYGTTSTTGQPPNANTFDGCTWAGNGNGFAPYGVYFDAGTQNIWLGGSIEGWTVGARFQGTAATNYFFVTTFGANGTDIQDAGPLGGNLNGGFAPPSTFKFSRLQVEGSGGWQLLNAALVSLMSATNVGGVPQIAADTGASANQDLRLYAVGTGVLRLGDTDGDVAIGRAGRVASFVNALSLGAIPATVSTIRLPSQSSMYFRNFNNNADARIFTIDGADNLIIGSTAKIFLEQPVQIDGTSLALAGGKMTNYNGVVTAGWGIPAIYGSGRATAQVAANASVATFNPAADGSFIVSGNVLVTTSTAHSFQLECAYTDEGGTARVVTFNVQQLGGTLVTTITDITGAGPYEGVPLHIRAKGGNAITVRTNAGGTYTTVTYNVEGAIIQIA